MQKQNLGIRRILPIGVILIFILLPFHALLTAWYASNFGSFDAVRLWKEALLAFLCLVAILLIYRDKKLRTEIRKDKLFILSGAFISWTLLMTVFGLISGNVSAKAAGYGLIIDTRFFLFMLLVIIAMRSGLEAIKWQKYIFIPAGIVITFGLLQFILPNDFLRHFGYGNETLKAFQAVDNKPELARLQSTLRGPNPLGAYLVPILTLFIAQLLKVKRKKWIYLLGAVASLVVLFGTYSRSAWVGAAVSTWLLIFISVRSDYYKKLLYIATTGLLIISSLSVILLRNNDAVQNLAFHTNERSGSATSSNQQRGRALKDGLDDIIHNPLGSGVGSAGPASLRNDHGTGKLAENFFLQIGQESGVIGLVLFMAALAVIMKRLLIRRRDMLAGAVLASLGGLIIVNLVSHAWADDTLAYVLFGLIGTVLARSRKQLIQN